MILPEWQITSILAPPLDCNSSTISTACSRQKLRGLRNLSEVSQPLPNLTTEGKTAVGEELETGRIFPSKTNNETKLIQC